MSFIKRLTALILVVLIFNVQGFSGERKAVFSSLDAEMIHEGDVFRGRIQIWPVGHTESEKFNLEEGKPFLKKFVTVKTNSAYRSENNADVMFLEGLFVLLKNDGEEGTLTWDIQEERVLVDLEFEISKTKVNQKELLLFPQDEDPFATSPLIHTVLLLFGLFAAVTSLKLWRRSAFKRKREKEILKFKKFWGDKFESAGGRDEFEAVYSRKNEWLRLVNVQTPPIVEFFRTMEEVQYKKEWNKEEKESVSEAFEHIRSIFK